MDIRSAEQVVQDRLDVGRWLAIRRVFIQAHGEMADDEILARVVAMLKGAA